MAVLNIDEDVANADWIKMSWDAGLPDPNGPDVDVELMSLPVWQARNNPATQVEPIPVKSLDELVTFLFGEDLPEDLNNALIDFIDSEASLGLPDKVWKEIEELDLTSEPGSEAGAESGNGIEPTGRTFNLDTGEELTELKMNKGGWRRFLRW